MSRPRVSTDDVRQRIISVAEEQFRRLGYTKTTVADIAGELGMSPANIYRFFASKSAINEAICHRFLAECDALIAAIVRSDAPAPQRLATLITELHRFNRARYIGAQSVHEMVCVAMEENWQAVEAHLASIIAAFATLISEGIAAGDFAPTDPETTALTLKQACAGLLHPMMIAECMRHGRDMDEMCSRMVAFIHTALAARKALS